MEASVRAGFPYNQTGGAVSSANRFQEDSLSTDQPGRVPPVERAHRKYKPETRRRYEIFLEEIVDYGASSGLGFSDANGYLSWARRQANGVIIAEFLEDYAKTKKVSVRPMAMEAGKQFLEKNGVTSLPRGFIEPYHPNFIPGFRTREEIISLLSYLDNPVQKLFVLFQKDSGFRSKTTLSLEWHHLMEDYEEGRKFCSFRLEDVYYQGKKRAGLSFIGPDAIDELKRCIKTGRVKTSPAAKIFPFSYSALRQELKLACKKANLPAKLQPTHGLRKFFENALDRCVPPIDVDKKRQIEGHALGVRWHYTDQAIETLRPEYERAYPHLTLAEEALVDRKVKEALQTRDRKIEMLLQQNANYEQRLSDLEKNSVTRADLEA